MRYKIDIEQGHRPLVYSVFCNSGYNEDGTEKLFHTEIGANIRYDYKTRSFKTLSGWLIGTSDFEWSAAEGSDYDYLWEHYNPGIRDQIVNLIETEFADDIKKAKETVQLERFPRTIHIDYELGEDVDWDEKYEISEQFEVSDIQSILDKIINVGYRFEDYYFDVDEYVFELSFSTTNKPTDEDILVKKFDSIERDLIEFIREVFHGDVNNIKVVLYDFGESFFE